MATLLARFRAATTEDCYELARLFRIASSGVADYMWSRLAHMSHAVRASGRRAGGAKTLYADTE
jgi:hypothetical protein